MAKLIHAASLTGFKTVYTGWASSNADVYTSVAFTDDGYLYTHGVVFRLMRADQDFPYAVTLSGTGGTLKVDVGGASGTIPISGAGLTAGGSATTLTLDHSSHFGVVNTAIGGATSTTGTIPVISTDIYGHITALTTANAVLDHVTQNATSVNSAYNLLLSSGAGTSSIYFSTIATNPLTYNPSTGILSTPNLTVGGSTISDYVRALKATSTLFGTVKLVDSLDTNVKTNNNGAATSIAASQLALYNAYKAAIDYADQKITSAVSFKGTLGTTGTVTVLPTSGYTIGDEYKVITAGTYAGNVCEVGDMIIAIHSYTTGAVPSADWSVIQTNLTGALQTNGGTITKNAIVIGTDNSLVTGITVPSTAASFLEWDGTNYAWTNSIYRPIAVNGTVQFTGTSGTQVNFTNGTNTTVSYSSNNITINATDTLFKLIAGLSTSTSNAVTTNGNLNIRLLTTGNVNSGTLALLGSGHSSVISDASGNITISSSWRSINTYLLSNQTLTALAENNLNFSNTFGLKANTTTNISEIDIAWAEVADDAQGNVTVTYQV